MSTDETLMARVDAFIDELEELCKRHRLVLGHEDGHGRFTLDDAKDGETGCNGAFSVTGADGKAKYL